MKRITSIILAVLVVSLAAIVNAGCKTQKDRGKTQTEIIIKPSQPEKFTAKQLENESSYQKVFYISSFGNDSDEGTYNKPFKTLNKAKEEIRKINGNMTGDIAVVVREGTIYQTSKFVLDENDGGTNGFYVRYMGFPDEDVHINGGFELSNWKEGADGIWYMDGVKTSQIRDMYVDGVRAILAREPNGNAYHRISEWDQTNQKITVKTEDLKGAKENFETSLYMEWSQPVLQTESISQYGAKAILNFADWEGYFLFNRGYHEYQISNSLNVVFQNAKEFLDAPGEFYYSKAETRLYYMPRANEDMKKSRIAIPNTNSIFEVAGSDRVTRAQNIIIEGFTVENTGWFGFSKYGYMEDQANHYGISRLDAKYMAYDVLPGAIQIKNAEKIYIKNCNFTNLGATGVNFYSAFGNGSVEGCTFTDIGATAVMIAPHITGVIQDQNLYNPTDQSVTVHDIDIVNNYIAWTGMNFHRSCGITNVLGYNINICHNEVKFSNNIGIHNGWGWTLDETVVKNNAIKYNDVSVIGMNGSDSGAIYTLSYQPGTVIEENYIHEINIGFNGHDGNTSPAYGLYIDEGSNHVKICDNQLAYARENVLLIYYHTLGTAFEAEGNKGLLLGDELDGEIVAAAGLESGYKGAAEYVANDKKSAADYFLAGLWTNSGEDGNYGYKAEVKKDRVVYGLGRMKINGNTDIHTLTVYDENKKAVASCTVNMKNGVIDKNGYVNALFQKPITLKSGKTYYIVSSEKKDGDLYFDANSYIYTDDFMQVVGMVKGSDFKTVRNLNSCYVGINLLID